MKHTTKVIALILIASLVLSGCDVLGKEATPTPEPSQAEDFNAIISATGVVVPEQWAVLSMKSSGVISEVLVAEGARVTAGQPLLRLDGEQAVQAEVSVAQVELLAAQQALDDLHQNDAIDTSSLQLALSSAQQALIDAQRQLVPFELQAYQDELDRAREAVTSAEDDLETAQEDFEPYADWDDSNDTYQTYHDKLEEVQRIYDEAYRVEQELILDKDRAFAAVAQAEANVAYAQDSYEEHTDGPNPDELAMAKSRLDQANARLAAVQQAVRDLELVAPFDGVVCNLQARLGEWLAMGQPVLELGELNGLRVETTDLNEIDAARLYTDEKVIVTFDALPGVSVDGTVQRIAHKSAAGSGVYYTAVIGLDEIPSGLLWGMTAFVDIEVEE